MSRISRAIRHVATLAFTISGLVLLAPAHAATAPPKVVFIGDQYTYNWTSAFAANPNWVNQGWKNPSQLPSCANVCEGGTSSATLDRFQADVINLHPAIVHIMVGADDASVQDAASYQYAYPGFLSALDDMVKMAKAANIQVILGIEPAAWSNLGPLEPINSIIANYGAANKIPVINYGDALCGCVGSTGGSGIGVNFSNDSPYMALNPSVNASPAPTAAGYALMTQMAEAVINTLNLTLQGGYLQNVQQFNDNVTLNSTGPDGPSNVNTVYPAAVLQFTPYGYYAGGLLEPFLNSSYAGSTGTWASSNPLVMSVGQTGLATALSPGTAIITYTSPTGVKFSEWIMYVSSPV